MLKKEITLAVIIGLIISLIVGGGIFRAKQAITHLETKKQSSPQPSSTSSGNLAQDNQSDKLFLKILSPQNGFVTSKDNLTLKGETLPQTYITIITDKSEYLIVPDGMGHFSQQIKLIKGANLIKVTVYTKQGQKTTQSLNAVYTQSKI